MLKFTFACQLKFSLLKRVATLLGAAVAILIACPATAEPSRAAFDAPDVPSALHQVFGRSKYTATDKIKIQAGLPGRTRPLSAMLEGYTHSIIVFIDMPGPKKIAFLMGEKQAEPNLSSKLLAIYTISEHVGEIMVPIYSPYNHGRITVVVEAGNSLWGTHESFHIGTSSSAAAGRDSCDDLQRDRVARFTAPVLDNMAGLSFNQKTGLPIIHAYVQHAMNWEPVLDRSDCTFASPSAIRSLQLAYNETEIAVAEWGPGISKPALMLALPSLQHGKQLNLHWQDTHGKNFEYSSAVSETPASDPSPLHTASAKGNLEEVRRLLAAGININSTLANGWTALGFAAKENQAEVIEYLLNHGADPNIRFQYGDTALMWAAYLRNPAIVTALLAHNADGKARDKFGNNLFSLAVHGRAQSRDASFNRLPREDWPVVQILIAHGLIDTSEATMTALQIAAEKDNYRVIKALMDSGFNPAVNVGDTPLLIWAVKHGYTELAATMLVNGAPVNVENKRCETPLLAALKPANLYLEQDARLEHERKDMVELLLKHGAKPSRKNSNGINAYKAVESLREKTRDEMLRLLTSGAVDTSKN